MKKQKIKFDQLVVVSFVTTLENSDQQTIGGGMTISRYTPILTITRNVHNPDCPVYQTGISYIPRDCTIAVNGGQA